MRKFFASAGFCLALALASISQAATIDIGNHILLPNTANQQIRIFAAGGEEVQGVDMFLELGMQNNQGPTITGVALQGAGTLFGSNSTPPNTASLPGNPRYWTADVATLNGTIPLQPTTPLAIVTIDTTGITAGSSNKTFVLNLSPAPNLTKFLVTTGSFELFPVGSTQGTIVISAVPEPSTMVLAGLAGIALIAVGARRKA